MAAVIDKLISNVSGLNPFHARPGRKKYIIALDLGGDSLRLAYTVSSSIRKQPINILSRNTAGMSDDDIAKTLKDVLISLEAKSSYIIDVVPSSSSITKNIEIPSTDAAEIRQIINLQADRHTPYSRQEMIVDYIDIGRRSQSYTKILLVIVARNVVRRHIGILLKAGLMPQKIVFAPESLAWFAAHKSKAKGHNAPAGIIHIDGDSTDFIAVSRERPLFIRNIPLGAKGLIEERDAGRARFFEEVKRSLEAYNSEGVERPPDRLILTGALEGLDGLERGIEDAAQVPLITLEYLSDVKASDEPAGPGSVSGHSSFLNLVATLIAPEKLKVDLTPEDMVLRRSLEERGRALVKTGILVLSILVLTFFLLLSKVYLKSSYLARLDKEFSSSDAEAERLEEDFSRVNLVKKFLRGRGYSLEVLSSIYDIAPPNLLLNNIQFEARDEEGRFSIGGTADSMSTVFAFVGSMEESSYFKNVKTRYTTKRKDGLLDVTDFEISAVIEGWHGR